ncbi:NHL repeat-containing protein [Nonomuraea recticatena]|uniref:hypothetical protein n=1 Tax=Nonomuraea recticatena TaxID=46178 RepID=UPI00360A6C15
MLLLGGVVAPGPGGKTVIWSASSGVPAHLNAVDPATGAEVARFDLPDAGGAWAVDATPDGSVYAGTYGNSHLFRWTEKDGVKDLGNPLQGETFVWTLAAGEGATVYGGTSPGGRLFGYDPATGVRDYGRLSPRMPTSVASPPPTARSTRERRPPPRSSRSTRPAAPSGSCPCRPASTPRASGPTT